MSNPSRHDDPGSRHHVMNRPIAQRVMFDGDVGARKFLELVAEEAHVEGVRIECFVLMPNHFHFVAVSDRGRLGDAMRRIEGRYVKGFNLRQSRAGGLVRSRFTSKRIRSLTYHRRVIAYIDRNPSDAGIASTTGDYEFSSRTHYRRRSGPPWMSRSWIEAYVRTQMGKTAYDPEDYDRVFRLPISDGCARWLDSTIASNVDDSPTLDDLVFGSHDSIRRWMEDCARNADGTSSLVRSVDAESVVSALEPFQSRDPTRTVRRSGRRRSVWATILCGLLRDFAGATWDEIANLTGASAHAARNRFADHLALMKADAAYADLASLVARAAITECHGTPVDPDRQGP